MSKHPSPFEVVLTKEYGSTEVRYSLNYRGFHIGSYTTFKDAQASLNRWNNSYKRTVGKREKHA